MKLLVYGINYSPELTGIGKYTGEMCEWLARNGMEVVVVTAPPYYPEWRVGEGYSNFRYTKEFIGKVTVLRCPLWIPQKPSGMTRLFHLASFAISSAPILFWTTLKFAPNVILTLEPTFFGVPAALAASRLSRAVSWLHIQDFEIDAAFELGLLRAPQVRKILSLSESALTRAFDRVSTISKMMLARLYQKGVERDRAILFPNWVNLDNIYPDREAGRAFRSELAIPENVIIALYSGNMGEKQGLRTVIDAATLLNDRKDIFFLMCGDGSARESLVKQAEGLVNIKFIDLQPLERLNGLLNSADIHLLPQRADAADLVLPSKLTGMLASGSPVVAGAERNTSIGEIIQEAGGLCCKPENAEEMAHAIAELAECEALRQEYGRRAREYALKNFSQSAVLAELRRQLESLVLEQYA